MIRVALADDQELVRAGFAALLDAEDDLDVVGEAADGEQAVLLAERCAPDVLLMDIRMPGVDGIEATRRIASRPDLASVHVVILTTFDLDVVGEAADAEQAVRLAERHAPDVLLMDIRMPRVDGIEATRRIAARPDLASVHVVILTTFELDEYVFEGLRAGAAGFLVKDTDAAELIRAVRVVASGEAILTPTVTRRLIAEFALRTRSPRQLPHLDELTPREREVVALIATGLSNDEISRKIYISPATAKTHASRAMTKLGARDRAQLVVFAYQAGLIRPG